MGERWEGLFEVLGRDGEQGGYRLKEMDGRFLNFLEGGASDGRGGGELGGGQNFGPQGGGGAEVLQGEVEGEVSAFVGASRDV